MLEKINCFKGSVSILIHFSFKTRMILPQGTTGSKYAKHFNMIFNTVGDYSDHSITVRLSFNCLVYTCTVYLLINLPL